MNAFERFFYGAHGARARYLFSKLFLLMLALDTWMLMIGHAGRYGVAGFNVAHFGWLDALLPLPSARSYVAVLLLTGLARADNRAERHPPRPRAGAVRAVHLLVVDEHARQLSAPLLPLAHPAVPGLLSADPGARAASTLARRARAQGAPRSLRSGAARKRRARGLRVRRQRGGNSPRLRHDRRPRPHLGRVLLVRRGARDRDLALHARAQRRAAAARRASASACSARRSRSSTRSPRSPRWTRTGCRATPCRQISSAEQAFAGLVDYAARVRRAARAAVVSARDARDPAGAAARCLATCWRCTRIGCDKRAGASAVRARLRARGRAARGRRSAWASRSAGSATTCWRWPACSCCRVQRSSGCARVHLAGALLQRQALAELRRTRRRAEARKPG